MAALQTSYDIKYQGPFDRSLSLIIKKITQYKKLIENIFLIPSIKIFLKTIKKQVFAETRSIPKSI